MAYQEGEEAGGVINGNEQREKKTSCIKTSCDTRKNGWNGRN